MSICTHGHPLLCKDAQRTRIQHLADAFISIIPHSWHLGPRVCQSLPGVGLCPNQRYLGNTKELKALTSSAGKNPLNFVSLLYLKLVPPHGTFTSCNIRPSPTPFPLWERQRNRDSDWLDKWVSKVKRGKTGVRYKAVWHQSLLLNECTVPLLMNTENTEPVANQTVFELINERF